MSNQNETNSNHIYSVLFVNSLKITKSSNHPQIDVFGNVLTCPILMSANAGVPNWSNQWVSLSAMQNFPDWSIDANTATVASRSKVKRGIRTGSVIEPFYNITLIKGHQPTLNHFGGSIQDIRDFAKKIHLEILGTESESTIVDEILSNIIRFSVDTAITELRTTKEAVDAKFKLYDLSRALLSKYLYGLICREKDFADFYKPDTYKDLEQKDVNDVFSLYSMSINVLHFSPSITELINTYKACSLVVN